MILFRITLVDLNQSNQIIRAQCGLETSHQPMVDEYELWIAQSPVCKVCQIQQINMSSSHRNNPSRSLERKSLQRDQLNALLYKNIQGQGLKETSLGNSSRMPNTGRSKVKSSQGSYRQYKPKKHSIEVAPTVYDRTGSISAWVKGGLLLQRRIRLKASKNNFDYAHVVGRGGFSKVWKVEEKKTGRVYALKEMSKALIITKKSIPSVLNEKRLLSQLKHPFLDKENLYLVMEFMTGGDLRYHICSKRRFSEEETRFFIACVFYTLEYLHSQNIIHRDIKPENLVIDEYGYLRLTDFGIAKEVRPDNASDTSGTPGYMAPEVMCCQNHAFGVDYYALGVIGYELMIGRRPYPGRSRPEIREQILSRQACVKKQDIPEGWSIQAADFINRLLQRKPMMRLGWGGADEIKNHPWLKSFPWQKLARREIQAPYRADKNANNFDGRHHVTIEDEQMSAMLRENGMLLRKSSVQELFQGYTHQQETEPNTTTSEFWKKKCL